MLIVQLYLGPDDGDELPATGHTLPDQLHTARGLYVRDPAADLVRADGTPVHRYRWTGSRPPHQVPA